jgi:hypothetical protein
LQIYFTAMKKLILLKALLSILICFNTVAQDYPDWTRQIVSGDPDIVYTPVKTITNSLDKVIVLANSYEDLGGGNYAYGILCRQFDAAGNVDWTFTSGNGIYTPRAFDAATDQFGNWYIAAQDVNPLSNASVLIKLDATGNMEWTIDSVQAFTTGGFLDVETASNSVFAASPSGIALIDFTGNEIWSNNFGAHRLESDNSGKIFFSHPTISNGETLMSLDTAGNATVIDTNVYVQRIEVDGSGNIYTLNTDYKLVKYDQQGVKQWEYVSFPPAPPFGDIGMEIVIDQNSDIIVVGVGDSMIKLDPTGVELWRRSMNGMDSYLVDAAMNGPYLTVAGTVQGTTDYDLKMAYFDTDGSQVYSIIYNGTALQEFMQDMAVHHDAIYIVNNNDQNSELLRLFEPLPPGSICVDSVWYDPNNPNLINVTVYNGNTVHLDYPSVQIIAPSGDTISNPTNFVNFFAHPAMDYTTYTDSITVQGITDFTGYTFIIYEGFGSASYMIDECLVSGVGESLSEYIQIYPNPAAEVLYINLKDTEYHITDPSGRIIKSGISEGFIYIKDLASGMYFLTLKSQDLYYTTRFIKE